MRKKLVLISISFIVAFTLFEGLWLYRAVKSSNISSGSLSSSFSFVNLDEDRDRRNPFPHRTFSAPYNTTSHDHNSSTDVTFAHRVRRRRSIAGGGVKIEKNDRSFVSHKGQHAKKDSTSGVCNWKSSFEEYFYVAALFHNSQFVVENFVTQLQRLRHLLEPSPFFVSIVESGSSDDTVRLLNELRVTLAHIGVPHFIVTERVARNETDDRVDYIATLRNEAMRPLTSGKFLACVPLERTRVLFFNDVLFVAEDVVRLLQTNNGVYDAACAMDFYYTFYDRWVSRDVDGQVLSGWYPYVANREARANVFAGKPFRVFTCWNGLIAIRSALTFVPIDFGGSGIAFRGSDVEFECFWASESLLFTADMVKVGRARIFVNPAVKVVYDSWFFYHLQHWLMPGINFVLGLVHSPDDSYELRHMPVEYRLPRDTDIVCSP